MLPLVPFTSVIARDGALNLAPSSSSPTVPRRLRTRNEVLRPPSSDSSPASRRLRKRAVDFLPSSASSVTARRARDMTREALRAADIESLGVAGVDAEARGLVRGFPFNIMLRRSSYLDVALGLLMICVACSGTTLERRETEYVLLFIMVGVFGGSGCELGLRVELSCVVTTCGTVTAGRAESSPRAMQSSVRLRQTLSVLRRS